MIIRVDAAGGTATAESIAADGYPLDAVRRELAYHVGRGVLAETDGVYRYVPKEERYAQ